MAKKDKKKEKVSLEDVKIKTKKSITLLTDQAIGESEDCSRGDGLGFEAYADVIANAAIGTSGPFTIGVFGEWGTGKTSLMKLIGRKLKDEENVITVWFNAWQYEKEEMPIVPLIGTIVQQIERNKTFREKLKEGGKSLLRSLRAIAYGFSASTEVAIPGFATVEAGFVAKDMIDREESLTPDPLIERSLYYSAFDTLAKAPLPANTRVVVLIDDLDRCFPDKAIRLLESIKLVLAQRGFIFVLGVARTVIEGYLKHRYEKQYGIKDFEGSDYLDKIVQLAFPIPSHTGRMDDLAKKLIAQVDDSQREQVAAVIPLIAEHLGANPRSLVRFINNVLIDVEISELTHGGDVPLEFFAITRCLQLRWRAFYDVVVFDTDLAEFAARADSEKLKTTKQEEDSPNGKIARLISSDAGLEKIVKSDPCQEWLLDHDTREKAVRFVKETLRTTETKKGEQYSVTLVGGKKATAIVHWMRVHEPPSHQTYELTDLPKTFDPSGNTKVRAVLVVDVGTDTRDERSEFFREITALSAAYPEVEFAPSVHHQEKNFDVKSVAVDILEQ